MGCRICAHTERKQSGQQRENAGRKANQLPYRISETRRELADDASAMAGPAHELTVNQRVRAAAAPDTRSRRFFAAVPVAHRARPARLQKMPKAGGFQPAGTPQMSWQRQTAVGAGNGTVLRGSYRRAVTPGPRGVVTICRRAGARGRTRVHRCACTNRMDQATRVRRAHAHEDPGFEWLVRSDIQET